jgi:hypothetical protein
MTHQGSCITTARCITLAYYLPLILTVTSVNSHSVVAVTQENHNSARAGALDACHNGWKDVFTPAIFCSLSWSVQRQGDILDSDVDLTL